MRNDDWLDQYEREMQDWQRHTDWTIAHRAMLLKEAATRELPTDSGIDWIILLIEVIVCIVLTLAWLR